LSNDLSKSEKIATLHELGFCLNNGETNEHEPWVHPIPLQKTKVLPNFPIDALPKKIRNYVEAVSESLQVPVDMPAVISLPVLSICLQGKYKIKGKEDWIEPLNLYCVVIAPPAERKSGVMKLMTTPISEFEKKINKNLLPIINENRLEKELLEKQLKNLSNKVQDDPSLKDELLKTQKDLTNFEEIKPIRLITDDVTPEALTSLLADNNSKMAVVSAEGGIFDIMTGRYNNSANIEVFLKAHCGDDIIVDRKGRASESIAEPALTVALAVQPAVLEGIMSNPILRGRGLIARFLYSIPQSKVGYREFETTPIPLAYQKEYKKLCSDLLNIKHKENAPILTLSPEAKDLLGAFFISLEPRIVNDLEDIADFAGKMHGTVLRIAGLLHLAENQESAVEIPLPGITMQKAIDIGFYFIEHAQAAYQIMGTDERIENAKYIIQKLKNQAQKEMSKNYIYNLCRGKLKKMADFNKPFELLQEYGYVREKSTAEINTTGRKPSPIFEINPYIT
jgi:hypothetical protein